MKLKSLWKSLLILLISACSSMPPDVPVITRLGPNLCYYVYTISDKKGEVDDLHPLILDGIPYSCYDLILEGLIFPPYSYKEMKKYLLNECKKSKKCGKVGDWEDKFNTIESKSKGLL